MGEALLTRDRGSTSSGGSYEFKTEIITSNQTWVAPESKK